MALAFKKAVKRDAKLRLALCGPAGSGKTYSLLSIATELAGPIAYVDTEHGSASKYADLFSFDVIEPETFDPRDLISTIKEAAAAGYKVICIDSLSHYWMGKGGELEMVDAAAKRSQGNSFAGWKNVTPVHNELIDTIIAAPIHVIVSMRTKTEWVIEQVNGKSVPRKIGLAPVMRDGIEYQFDVCGDLDQDNTLTVTKSRCPELSGKVINRPGKDMAIVLRKWLAGAPPAAIAIPAPEAAFTPQPKPAKGEEQVPEALRALWSEAKDRPGIEAVIGRLCDAMAEKLGEDTATDEFIRLLGEHGVEAWQALGTVGKAHAFIRDLWAFEQLTAAKPHEISDSDLPPILRGAKEAA